MVVLPSDLIPFALVIADPAETNWEYYGTII
jgi:hypothetical protein